MADNTTTQAEALATVPAGEVFGFDDVDGVKIARSKTGFGVDGSYTDVSAADPLPVVQTGTPALPTGAATSANQDTLIAAVDGVEGLLTTIDADTGSIAASAATIAGAVSGTEMQVDVLTMPTVAVTDNAGSLTVDDGGGSLTVDGTVAVSGTVAVTDNSGSLTVDNAGTFAVQAAQSGTWNITNVSGTVSLPTGAATAAKQPALGTAGTPSADVITVQGVTSMTPLKVDGSAVTQPVSDAGGSLTVDGTVTVQDGGGSLTVDGTVAATQSGPWTVDLGATDNAVLDAIAASLAGTLTVTGGGGGTEYTEGDTDASITGSAIMWEDTSDTLRAVSAAKPLPVGDAGGSLTVDGTVAATQSGTWAVDLGATDNAVLDAMAASLAIVDNVVFGAGTEAAALRVTLATDSTGVVSVDDGGGALTVDGTVAVTGVSTLAEQQSQTTLLGTIDADTGTLAGAVSGTEMQVDVVGALPAGTNAIGKLAANSGVDIGDVDVTSVTPGTAATSLGKAIDSAAGATDTGVAILAVRDDSLSTLTPIEGDYVPLRVSSTGALHVTGGGGGTQYQEDTAHTTGDTGTMALAVRKDTAAALATTDGDYTPLITDANGALHVAVASGSVTASGTISVDTITTSVVPGTSATHLGKAEDAAHASGDTGVAVWGVRNDSAATSFGANGDYTPLATDANGRVGITDLGGAISVDDNGSSLTVDNAGTFAVQAASAGDTAHDSADSGNPVKVGAKAANALPTAVANGDRANAIADLFGRVLTAHIDPAMQVHKVVNVTTQQTGSDVWSPASGKKIAVTSVVIGSYGTTAGRVILWFGDNADTTYSAGTDQVLVAASFAPSSTAKPGLVYTPAVPVFCTTADRELHLTTDAAISLDITIEGYEW